MHLHQSKITIIGAGPGGSMAALFLAKFGIPCLLVEKKSFPRDKICGDALSAKCVDALNKLDPMLLDKFKKLSIQVNSLGVNFIAPSNEMLTLSFGLQANEHNSVSGYISKRIDFDNFLIEEVKQKSLITLIENCGIKDAVQTTSGWQLTSDDVSIQTELVIDASGAQSYFARHIAGIQKEDKHYTAGLRAYYKNIKGLSKGNYIELHFLKEFLPGYFWIFPLPNGEANVGVGMLTEVIGKNKINLKKEMMSIIENHPVFKERFAEAEMIDGIKGFGLPLGSKKRPLSGDRFMLVGDAASLIDPFTGEGISNAMISGMKAAEIASSLYSQSQYDKQSLLAYDYSVYRRLGSELALSTRLLHMLNYPWLFNFIVRKANKNKALRELMCCMFESVELRKNLKNPLFYIKLLINKN